MIPLNVIQYGDCVSSVNIRKICFISAKEGARGQRGGGSARLRKVEKKSSVGVNYTIGIRQQWRLAGLTWLIRVDVVPAE